MGETCTGRRLTWAVRTTCTLVLISTEVAFADPPAEGPEPSAFVLLDRMDGSTRAGIDLSYIFPNREANLGDSMVLRVDAHGEYFHPGTGLGVYVQVPFSHIGEGDETSGLFLTGGGSANALGDVEVGGVFLPVRSVALRAGVTLPTGAALNTADGDFTQADYNRATASCVGAYARISDLYEGIGKGTSLRLSASPMARSGFVFMRADIGLDANLSNRGTVCTKHTLMRISAGLGLELGRSSLMLESVNLRDFSSSEDGATWWSVVAISARFKVGRWSPYGALSLALNDAMFHAGFLQGPDGNGVSAVLTVGLDAHFR